MITSARLCRFACEEPSPVIHLQADYPDQYKDHVIAEMRKYVGSLSEHPTYRKFCQMMQLNQDEFASNILDDAIKAIT